MGRNSHYYVAKDEMMERARRHTANVIKYYNYTTLHSIKMTKEYGVNSKFKGSNRNYAGMSVRVVAMDTVSAIKRFYDIDKRIAALNFASYKNPGGRFMDGSIAQEECLCHESNLYNILLAFRDSYYDWNNRNKNRALYYNRGLYSPNVIFMGSLADNIIVNHSIPCDIITCAAPNYSVAHRYQGVQMEENIRVCKDRIKFVLDIAVDNEVDTLILGAYGCGVFGQDASEIAKIFKEYLNGEYKGKFQDVIFAIPPSKGRDKNLDKFISEIGKN